MERIDAGPGPARGSRLFDLADFMSRCVLLMDNGSLEPASTLQLREIAAEVEARIGVRVRPVSLAHSTQVSAEALGGRPAELFEAALDHELHSGTTEVFVVPLFIGPSHAIVRHVPAVVAERHKLFPAASFGIASPLYIAGDLRLASILADHIREHLDTEMNASQNAAAQPRVAIVDHGSPSRAVTEVRDRLTAQVRALLGDTVGEVTACSMERRPGPEFDFNEPTLDALLRRPSWNTSAVIVGMLFIGPGKHAGTGGNVWEICRHAHANTEQLRMTKLLGQHPLLIEILADRARQVFAVS